MLIVIFVLWCSPITDNLFAILYDNTESLQLSRTDVFLQLKAAAEQIESTLKRNNFKRKSIQRSYLQHTKNRVEMTKLEDLEKKLIQF